MQDHSFAYVGNSLSFGKEYSYLAYIKVDGSYHYGEVVSFSTPELQYSIQEVVVSDISKHTASLKGVVTIAPDKKRLIEYAGFTGLLEDASVQLENDGSFCYNAAGLVSGMTYTIKPFVVISGQKYYGAETVFRTAGIPREVEQAEDTYEYPEPSSDWTVYSPSMAVRYYKPIAIRYKSGNATPLYDQVQPGKVPGGKVTSWNTGTARIVHYLQNYEPETKTYGKYKTLTNEWGSSLTMERQAATGRFRVQKIGDRWWIIDPDGYVHYERGVTSFRHGSSARNATAFNERFGGDDQIWIATMQKELAETGIHATGAFCTNAYLPVLTYDQAHPEAPMHICPSFGFLSSFRSAKNGGKWPGGLDTYKALLVLHPDWPQWCKDYLAGSEFASYRGNKYVFGFFSDNEIPFSNGLLKMCLNLTDDEDLAKKGAVEFMQSMGLSASVSAVTAELNNGFLGMLAEKYYKAIREAVDTADPQLMYVGSRLHGSPKYVKQILEAAGRYCDIVSINYYSRWDVELTDRVVEWETWTGKHFMVTEFYTKGIEDSDLLNSSGAGWCVPTQKERAYAYQHFTLGLLEAKNCVGWTWFKYQDDDGSDNSGCPANKGLYDNYYQMYPILGKFMREVNFNVYDLIRYFDE